MRYAIVALVCGALQVSAKLPQAIYSNKTIATPAHNVFRVRDVLEPRQSCVAGPTCSDGGYCCSGDACCGYGGCIPGDVSLQWAKLVWCSLLTNAIGYMLLRWLWLPAWLLVRIPLDEWLNMIHLAAIRQTETLLLPVSRTITDHVTCCF